MQRNNVGADLRLAFGVDFLLEHFLVLHDSLVCNKSEFKAILTETRPPGSAQASASSLVKKDRSLLTQYPSSH